ncbi:MAG: hypothetical protein OEX02_18975, partial [Cyclobacteriaceae bacterium]|nr:hypothetical protein [Cyclobacteriaceae bacterium]
CLRETERTDLIEGLSQEQRFFISLGRLYAVKHAEEVPDNFMLSEGIDAGATVVNGVLTQVNAFRKVFSIISADSAIVNGGSNVEIW